MKEELAKLGLYSKNDSGNVKLISLSDDKQITSIKLKDYLRCRTPHELLEMIKSRI
jgi:hypothetical protein